MRWIKGASLLAALVLIAGCGAEKSAEQKAGKSKETSRRVEKSADSVKAASAKAKTVASASPSASKAPGPTSSATEATANTASSEANRADAVIPTKRADDISIYRSLQSKLAFSLLYPGYLPSGFTVADREAAFLDVNHGVQGFQVRYSKGGGLVTVLEGDVFNPAPGSSTEGIKTPVGSANLETMSDGSFAVYFSKNGTRFGISASGIEKSEVKKIASGLVLLSELK